MTEPKEIREAKKWMIANAPSPGGTHIAQLLNLFDKLNAEPVVYVQEAISEKTGEPLGASCIGTPLVWDTSEPFEEEGKPFMKYRRIPEEGQE